MLSEYIACKPRIAQIYLNEGGNLTLKCRISGSTPPDIEWIFNNRSIMFNNPRISIRYSLEVNRSPYLELYTSELTLIGVESIDQGVYNCVAKNHDSKVYVSFKVQTPVRLTAIWSYGVLFLMAFVFILIVIGLVRCCCCRRNQKCSNQTHSPIDSIQLNVFITQSTVE